MTPGSNPGVPTNKNLAKSNLPKANPRCFLTFREMARESRFSSCWVLLGFFRVFIRTRRVLAAPSSHEPPPGWSPPGGSREPCLGLHAGASGRAYHSRMISPTSLHPPLSFDQGAV